MLTGIYNALMGNPVIKEKVGKRIKIYEYPNSSDLNIGPYIVIDPLDTPTPDDYADGDWLTVDQLFQIEVWSKNRQDKDIIAKEIQKTLWDKLGYGNTGSGVDQYDDDLKVYRDARRYRGKEYVDGI